MSFRFMLAVALSGAFALSSLAFAAEPLPLLVIHGQQFDPLELAIPAGTKLKLVIRNQDALPAEFESVDLSREVIVPANGEVTIYVGPLEPGRYQFFNDFNRAMQGTVVVNAVAKGN